MRDIATRQIGLAPDARGKMHPPEIVYWTEERRRQGISAIVLLALVIIGGGVLGLTLAKLFIFLGWAP